MTRQEHLLTILSEECAEVSQRVSKALRFGLSESEPTGGEAVPAQDNATRILEEYCDLVGAMAMLIEEGNLPQWSAEKIAKKIAAKQVKIESFLAYSAIQGTLQ